MRYRITCIYTVLSWANIRLFDPNAKSLTAPSSASHGMPSQVYEIETSLSLVQLNSIKHVIAASAIKHVIAASEVKHV